MKNTLKNKHNYTPKHALEMVSLPFKKKKVIARINNAIKHNHYTFEFL